MTLADPTTAAALLGWLATFLVHSTLWIVGAWLVARLVDSATWRERLWKGALVGGLVTTLLVTFLSTPGLSWRWQRATVAVLPADGVPGQPIALRGSATGSAQPSSSESAEGTVQRDGSFAGNVASLAAPPQSSPRLQVESVLLWLWLLGAAVGLAHLGLAHLRLGRALRGRRTVEDGPLVATLESLSARAGLRRRPRLSTSSALASPVALARGEIVVPERALTRLHPSELETLLAHELAHVVRRDPWWLFALNALRRVLWPQPFLGLVTRRSMEAAELRCDELAARWTRGELALARCLAEVATWIGGRPTSRLLAGMAERPSALVERVERLLKPRHVSRVQGALVGAWLVAMLGVLGCEGPEVRPEAETSDVVKTDETAPGQAPEELAQLSQLGYVELEESEAAEKRAKLDERVRLHLLEQAEERRGLTTQVTQGTGGKQALIAQIEADIAAMQAEQAGLKPRHSRWKKLETEIQMLEAQRDQILLGMRVDAGEQGQVDTSGGSKLHVATIMQGGVSMSTASPHALRLFADGAIDCVTTQLVEPGSKDETQLVAHLEDIAAGMDRAPLDANHLEGPSLPNGTLRILIEVEAPHSLLQRTLQACAGQNVQIWRFSLVPVEDGKLGLPMPFALPHDLAEIPEAIEETDEDVIPIQPGQLELKLEVVSAGEPEKEGRPGRVLEYGYHWFAGRPMGGGGEIGSGSIGAARNLEELETRLRQAYAADSGLNVVIDAAPGTVYQDVVELLDVVVAIGFTDVTFVGQGQ